MNLNLTTATRYGLNILALLGMSIALYLGRSIFIPITISILLAAILWPSAKKLYDRYRMPWFLACSTTVFVLVIFGAGTFFMFVRAVPDLLADLPPPNNKEKQKEFYNQIRGQMKKALPFTTDEALPADAEQSQFFQYVSKTFEGNYITEGIFDLAKLGGKLLFEGMLVLFILLFLLLEGDMLANKVRNIFGPSPHVQKRVTAALAEMAEAVSTYLVWRTIVNIGLALVLAIVYYLVGLKQWHLWALITAVFCYVPYIGTIAAGIPPVLDALLNVGPGAAFGIIIFYSALVTFEGYIIVPWVMGRSMDLNATTVIISCVFWDYVWGTAGLFLAMPLMAGIKAVCLQVDGWRPWGLLMGSGDEAEDKKSMQEAEKRSNEEEQAEAEQKFDVDKTIVMEQAPLKKTTKP